MDWRDIPWLAALERELFGVDAWTEATWWAELAARPRRAYTVAVDDRNGVVGYAGVDLSGEVADVMTVAVAPSAQGQGLGAALVQHLVDTSAAHGAAHLLLEVRADNPPALRLYERAGFRVISTRRRYYQPGDVDAHVMRREVVP